MACGSKNFVKNPKWDHHDLYPIKLTMQGAVLKFDKR